MTQGVLGSLIVGYGEVGKALHILLKCPARDIKPERHDPRRVQYLHVCIPWMNDFHDIVLKYIRRYKPRLTIIHATVPPGTSRKLGACHVPIRGRAPLEVDIPRFRHYAGILPGQREEVVKAMHPIKVRLAGPPELTELAKILELERYGKGLEVARRQLASCRRFKVDYKDAVTEWIRTYNDGMGARGDSERFKMPTYVPPEGPIGGHCVVPGMKLARKTR